MIDRVQKLQKEGKLINPDDNPIYTLEERNYLGGKIKAFVEKSFSPIYSNLREKGVTWDIFGETLFYDRIIAGDRSKQANPRGITTEVAKKLRDDLYSQLSKEQIKALDSGVKDFREALKSVVDEAYKEGLYSKELNDNLQKNEAYATFQVIEHLENAVSSKIYKSIGTFKDIVNPADSSILKTLATIRAIEQNKVARDSIEFLKENYPEDVKEANTTFTGKGRRFIESKKPQEEKLIIYYKDGEVQGHYVDPYIAHSIKNESIGQTKGILKILGPFSFLNSNLFRPLFIGVNMGFQSFNALRDFQRFWKNVPGMSFPKALKRYAQAYPVSKARAFGIGKNPSAKQIEAQKLVSELEAGQVFSTTFTDLVHGEPADDKQIDHILRNAGINSIADKPRHPVLRPFISVIDFIQKVGNLVETMPKAAGYYELSKGKPLTRDQKSYIRRYLGSPDFLAGGYLKPATNEIFLFSNAITQGIRSDYEIATGPKTRSSYWWKTAKINFLPKILMFMAALGLFGATLKKRMEDASEYDKTNYMIVPLGEENGKTVYLRIPQDETGRLVGGLVWKGLNLFNKENREPIGKSLSEIFSFMGGQVPNISPAITTTKSIFEYISGQNPYDAFRGRNVLSDDVFKAGGARANKEFAGWVFNQLGGGIFQRWASETQTPYEQGPVEKTFNLPILSNIAGRFIRVTNYGETERLNQIKTNDESTKAERRLHETEIVQKYVKQAQADKTLTPFNRTKYEQLAIQEIFGGNPKTADELARVDDIRKKFRLSLTKSKGDAAVNSLIGATNAQKVEILKEIRGRMNSTEFADLRNLLLREKIVSPDVIVQVR